MKFRLTYEGPLRPTQRDAFEHERDKIAPHKHAIRRTFHGQLKQLWQENKFLRETKVDPALYPSAAPSARVHVKRHGSQIPLVEAVEYRSLGYRFVPLVLERWSLLCSLEILFLRRDTPGRAISAGDIDNRIKTLIDTLRPPRSQNELVGDDVMPGSDEDPFFCLLEDDNQVSHLSVETDMLLDPEIADEADKLKSRIIITVELRPYYVNLFNLSFA